MNTLYTSTIEANWKTVTVDHAHIQLNTDSGLSDERTFSKD